MPNEDHEKNRRAWNEMAEVHYKHPGYRVDEFLDGASTLKSIELEEVGDVSGLSLLHLFCQFGLDTLSWARLGASVTGVDISDKSIEYARLLTDKAKLKAQFIRCDVLDLVGKIDDRFDIVFQSYGTHCWTSDLKRWAQVVVHHLKPDGIFYMVDCHPVVSVLEYDEVSYFKKGPYRYSGEPDYCDRTYRIKNQLVEWQHTLADIVNSLIEAGLSILSLNEFDKSVDPGHDDWIRKGQFYYPPEGFSRFPLMFSIKAKKLVR